MADDMAQTTQPFERARVKDRAQVCFMRSAALRD